MIKLNVIAAILLTTAIQASADTVFVEDFQTTVLAGDLGATPYSERENGTYQSIGALPSGWTSAGPGVFGFLGRAGDIGILLNENRANNVSNTLTRSISNLIQGQGYVLQFDYFGDNRVNPYSFDVTINGVTSSFSGQGVAAPTGTVHTVSIPFVASGATTDLVFAETSPLDASPIIDNVSLSSAVPEPSTYALIGGSLLGLAAFRRRKI